MKKYLKHSVYLAILLSSISAGAVYAEVHDYDEHFSYDEVFNVRGKNQTYNFNEGVEFKGGKRRGYSSTSSLDIGKKASVVMNIGKKDSDKKYDGKFLGEVTALKLENGSSDNLTSLTIDANGGNLYFENTPIPESHLPPGSNYKEADINLINIGDYSEVKINAKSMTLKTDRLHPGDFHNFIIGKGANVKIELNGGDFISQSFAGNANKGRNNGIKVGYDPDAPSNFSVGAENINIYKEGLHHGGTGLYVTGNDKTEVNLNANDKLSINGFSTGIDYRYGGNLTLTGKVIEVFSKHSVSLGISVDSWNDKDTVIANIGTYGITDSIHIKATRVISAFGKGEMVLQAKTITFENNTYDNAAGDSLNHVFNIIGGMHFSAKGDQINVIACNRGSVYDVRVDEGFFNMEAKNLYFENTSWDVKAESRCDLNADEIIIKNCKKINVKDSEFIAKAENIDITSNKNDLWECGYSSGYSNKKSKVDLEANKLKVATGDNDYVFKAFKNSSIDVKANYSDLNGYIYAQDGGKISIASRDDVVDGWTKIHALHYGSDGVVIASSMDSESKSQIDFKHNSMINSLEKDGDELVTEYKNKPGSSAGTAIKSLGNAEINLNDKDSTYAVYGDIIAGKYSYNGVTSKVGGVVNIGGVGSIVCGDVLAANDGTVNINLVNGCIEGRLDSYDDVGTAVPGERPEKFEGVPLTDDGHINLTLDNSTWKAHYKNWVSELNLKDGIVDLASDESTSVAIKKLTGNGRFDMKLNSVDHSKSDMIYIGDGSGNHKINIIGGITGGYENITEDNPLRFATVMNSTGKFELVDASTVDGGIYDLKYVAAKENYDKNDTENEKYNSNQVVSDEFVDKVIDGSDKAENWIITGVKEKEESKAANAIIDMSRANYRNAVYMDRLNKRLGEARYLDGNDGIWVRMRHDRIGMQDAFRSSNTMYQVGYNKLYKSGEAGERHAGVAMDYLDGSTSYTNVGGEGEFKRYGLWMYDTWFGDKGHYTDYVVKYGHMKNDFDITAMTTGEQITGDYNNNMFSASAEYGRKHEFGDNWYVEPQVQLQFARITGADYATTQGTDVSVDAVNSLIARAGFRLGKNIDSNSTVYFKADIMHEFLGDQDITARDNTGTMDKTFENKGTWYDLGFGFTTALSENSYAYLDVEQSFGNDNEDTYEINVGMKWSF